MRRFVAVAIAALCVLAPAGPAGAAETTATPAPSVSPASIDVQFWTEDVGNRTTVIVVAVIPTGTPLPAAVTMPVPKNAQVTWAGEIFTDAASDIQRAPQIAAGGTELTLVAQKSRTVQYEAQYGAYVDRGGRRYAKLEWVQTTPSDRQHFSVRLPLVSDDVKIRPEPVRRPFVNDAGDKLYPLPDQALKTGQKLEIDVDYIPRLPQSPRAWGVSDYVLAVAGGLLAVAVIALLVLLVRNRRAAGPREDDGYEDDFPDER